MAISSAICSSFKQELLQGKHDFDSSGGDTFKVNTILIHQVETLLKLHYTQVQHL
jgi:hypothetical protein